MDAEQSAVPKIEANAVAHAAREHMSVHVIWWRALHTCACALAFGALLFGARVGADDTTAPASTQAQQESLRIVRTILLAGEATTWLSAPEPPYDIGVTLKMKLERAGFLVVFDQDEPHDAVLLIRYRESAGREYARLEQGTNITCDLALRHSAVGTVQTYRIEATTTWPSPAGSLYWDAVRNFEENPYYYYLGELVKARLSGEDDAGALLARMLKEPPMPIPTDGAGAGSQAPGYVVANQEARLNAIRELGRMKDRRALETLWYLIAQPHQNERVTAVAAIGEIGDPASLDRLGQLSEAETDPRMRSAIQAAMSRIRTPQ